MKVARHIQSTKIGSLLNFSNNLRKSIWTAFLFYCDAKDSDTLMGSSHVCCYLFWVAVVKNGRGLLDHGTEIYCISREWIDKIDFFVCWYKFRKANVNLVIIG